MPDFLLGIDSGGTMTKAALFTLEGEEVAAEYSAVPMLFPEDGFTERDPRAMWHSTCKAIITVIGSAGITGDDIHAVCATGFGSGLFCIDAHGEPTCNGIVSTDSRAMELVQQWRDQGLETPVRASLAQNLWPAQSLTLLGWFQRHRPEVARKTTTILACKDYTKFRLTGKCSTDVTDAAIGGLLDMASGEYAESVFTTLNLESWLSTLPQLMTSEALAGEITTQAAQATGLATGTPVINGAVDVVCSTIATGVIDASQLAVVAGTWSINNALRVGAPQTDPVPVLQTPYLTPNTYLACEASATSASNLEWCCNHVFDAERAAAEAEGVSIYDRCGQMVATRRDAPPELTFLPYMFGGPAGAPAGFIGMQARHERADLVYAVYEGIAYAHKRHVDQLVVAGDTSPDVLRLAGGGARSTVWAQLFADVFGLPVEVADGSEFGALGACMVAAVGMGIHADYPSAVSSMSRVARRFEPDSAHTRMHAERFAQFDRLSTAVASAWNRTR